MHCTTQDSARRLYRLLAIVVTTAAALFAGACSSSTEGAEPSGAGTWRQLDEPPIEGRTDASVVATDGRVFVFGGWTFTCPPTADCSAPEEPPLTDGAILDLSSNQWETMAPMPFGVAQADAVGVGPDVYVLSQCTKSVACPAGHSMLRYRTETSSWDRLPPPGDGRFFRLAPLTDGLLAYADSDENGEFSDFLFDFGDDTWSPLPDDPLPRVYDRQVVEFNGRLMIFGSPVDGSTPTKLGAVFDSESLRWSELAESGTMGYQVWRAGDQVVLNPHFGDAEGGLYDPATNTWSDLPAPPDAETWRNDLAGVIGADQATFSSAAGWILDADNERWIEITPRPGFETVGDETIVAAGTNLVVFGGQRWADDGNSGELLNETWVWSADR